MSVVANIAINVDSTKAVSQLNAVDKAASGLSGNTGKLQQAFGGLNTALAGLGLGLAFKKIIDDVQVLDTNMRRLGTVGGDVKALDQVLGALSQSLGGVANKAELAEASYQALSAGFTNTSDNLKVVEAATKAAVGGMVDITSVVEVTTKTLNAYGMSADQSAKVTDSISKAVEFGQVQWSDYTTQLGRVASIAATAGVSLDEVNAFIAAATKNGATAEVAFTGLGSTLATMLKPSKESAEAAKQLGIDWSLSGIKGEGFESLMGKLAKAMKENPMLAAEMVGGQEALRGAFAAASNGGKDYSMILEGLGGAAGKTNEDFEKMKGSLENQLKALDTAFKNLSESLGKALMPILIPAVQALTAMVNAFASLPAPIQTVVVGIGLVATAILAIGAAVAFLAPVIAGFKTFALVIGAANIGGIIAKWLPVIVSGLAGIVGAVKAAGALILAVFSGPVGWTVLAVAAVVAMAILFRKPLTDFAAWVSTWGKTVGQFFTANVTTPITKAWQSMVEFLPKAMNTAATTIKSVFTGVGTAIKAVLNSVLRGVFGAVNGAIGNINRLVIAANNISAKVKGPQLPTLPTLSVPQFANGGVVTSPTLAMVGEGGEPEYIIPESKMAAASANYLNGARGGSVIPSGNAQINVTTGPVMQQGGQQYVSMADLERAMRATANGVYASLRTPAGRYATGVR